MFHPPTLWVNFISSRIFGIIRPNSFTSLWSLPSLKIFLCAGKTSWLSPIIVAEGLANPLKTSGVQIKVRPSLSWVSTI